MKARSKEKQKEITQRPGLVLLGNMIKISFRWEWFIEKTDCSLQEGVGGGGHL